MYKVGDILVCKSFSYIINGVYRDIDPNIIIGNSYKIMQIYFFSKTKLMFRIIGEEKLYWYLSKCFYNKSEVRKIKLNKICTKLEI